MVINMAPITLYIFIYIFITGGLSYYLARRKTNTPILATLIGMALCILPPLNIIYIVVLIIKNNVVISENINTPV